MGAPLYPPSWHSHTRFRKAGYTCFFLITLGCAPPQIAPDSSRTIPVPPRQQGPISQVGKRAASADTEPPRHSTPRPAEPPKAQQESAPPGDVSFGPLPGGAYLDRLDPRGRLLSFCARNSTAETPSLFLARPKSPPESVEAIFLVSPSGRYWVLLSNRTVRLVDAESGESFDLSSRGAPSAPEHPGDPPRFAFSADEKWLYYLSESGASITTLALAALNSSSVDSSLALEEPARGIRWASSYLQVVGPPRPKKAKRHFHACESSQRYLASPDASNPDAGYRDSVWLWTPSEPRPFPAPGFVLAHLNGFVRREGTGELLWVEGKAQKTLAPESCGGRVLLTDARRPLFLVSCEEYAPGGTRQKKSGKKERTPRLKFPLFLVAPSYSLDLNVELYRAGTDAPSEPYAMSKLFELRPGSEVIWLSPSELRTTRAPSGARLLAQTEEHLLIAASDGYSILKQSDFPFALGSAAARPQPLPILPLQDRKYRGAYFCGEEYCGNWERGLWMDLAGRAAWYLDAAGSILLAHTEGAATYLTFSRLSSLNSEGAGKPVIALPSLMR